MTGLSERERDQVTEFLSDPLGFPGEFKNWLTDWLSVNIPDIPVSQVMGYKGTVATSNVVNTPETPVSPERTWTDLPSRGPEITGLGDGTYLCMFGCQFSSDVAGPSELVAGVSVNGGDPVIDVSYTDNPTFDYSGWRAHTIEVSGNNDNNSVRLKYWFDIFTGGTVTFRYRWLTLLRIT